VERDGACISGNAVEKLGKIAEECPAVEPKWEISIFQDFSFQIQL
jgi:hypothetical protein